MHEATYKNIPPRGSISTEECTDSSTAFTDVAAESAVANHEEDAVKSEIPITKDISFGDDDASSIDSDYSDSSDRKRPTGNASFDPEQVHSATSFEYKLSATSFEYKPIRKEDKDSQDVISYKDSQDVTSSG